MVEACWVQKCFGHLFQTYLSTSGSKACLVNILVERARVMGNTQKAREGDVERGRWTGE